MKALHLGCLIILGMISPYVIEAKSIFANSVRDVPCQWTVFLMIPQLNFQKVQFVNDQIAFGYEYPLQQKSPKQTDCLWKTQDGGLHWQSVYCKADLEVVDLQFITPTEGWFLSSNMMYTQDGGKTWVSHQIDPEKNDLSLGDIYFLNNQIGWVVGHEPNEPRTTKITAETRGVIYATTDGGQTWKKLSPVFDPQLRWNRLNGIWAHSLTDLWVVSNGSILHSVNGGKTWQSGGVIPGHPFWPDHMAIEFLDRQVGWIRQNYRSTKKHLFTADGGQTWKLRNSPQENFSSPIQYLNPLDEIVYISPKVGWAQSLGIWYHTIDGAKSWQLTFPVTEGERFTLQYVKNERLVVATSNLGVLARCSIAAPTQLFNHYQLK